MHVLLTRPQTQATRFAAELRHAFGDAVETIISPLLEMQVLPANLDTAGFEALVFTSQNGVAAYAKLGGPLHLHAFCVGDRTAEAARAIGLTASSAGGDLVALSRLIATEAPGKRLLHPSGAHVAGQLEGAVTRQIVYTQKALPLSQAVLDAMAKPKPMIVPLFSPRSAALFQAGMAQSCRAQLHAICLSAAVADQLVLERFASLRVCKSPSSKSVLTLMRDLVAH